MLHLSKTGSHFPSGHENLCHFQSSKFRQGLFLPSGSFLYNFLCYTSDITLKQKVALNIKLSS